MKIIVHPQRGTFKILFYDDRAVRGVGVVELSKGPKGMRPSHYRLGGRTNGNSELTPPKELIDSLRKSQVFLTRKDEEFEEFLDAFQVPVHYTDLCRMCLLEERVTPLDRKTSVKFGKKEQICPECAKRELRRELAHMGKIGRSAMGHIDELLARFRDIDKVLASVQPDEKRAGKTLYDRLEAHAVQKTASLAELPLPRGFVDAAGVEYLMPAQQMAVDAGLLYGKDLLIVSATASGKTFIGEMAGMKNYLEGRGRTLFLVPLVALAVQKYHRFDERYGKIAGAGLMIGKSRVRLKDSQQVGDRNSQAPLLVGTYEGVDHMIRTGKKFTGIGTVVIDEVQMLEDQDRGHRLDGLIARLKFLAPKAQFLYLSATIGLPKVLAKKLSATLVRYDERPVALERYLYFIEHKQKIGIIKKACAEEYAMTSSKGFHGQTIVFTHSRARCHVIADALGPGYTAYHAGLTAQERRDVEEKFLKGKLKAVVTTAALGAGVDFPASQVIFDSLAMGISWLSVQEFHQMAGRAGRPDYHDLGKVMILAEPGGTSSRSASGTEEEVALRLLKGEMEEVAPVFDAEQSSEEFAANAVVADGDYAALDWITSRMVGSVEPVADLLTEEGLIRREKDRLVLMPLARVMAEHFIGVERLLEILRLVKTQNDPIEILAELECSGYEQEKREREKKGRR